MTTLVRLLALASIMYTWVAYMIYRPRRPMSCDSCNQTATTERKLGFMVAFYCPHHAHEHDRLLAQRRQITSTTTVRKAPPR